MWHWSEGGAVCESSAMCEDGAVCECVPGYICTSIHGRKVSGFEGGEGNSWSAHPMCSSWLLAVL